MDDKVEIEVKEGTGAEGEVPVPLDISDEEFENFSPDQYFGVESSTEDSEDEDNSSDDETEDEDLEDETDDTDEGGDEDSEEDDDTSDEGQDSDDEDDDSEDDDSKDDTSDEEEDDTDDEDDTSDDTGDVNYEDFAKRIMQPFKANGREMKVDTPDDAIALMQMGANYNKKMHQLKPALRVVRMLENQGLLDEAKISRLIDLEKKDPKAIAQLVKESGIDPVDIDVEQDTGYKPSTNYNVDDTEMVLDDVLTNLEGSEGFQKTMDIISTKWDKQSKQILVSNPVVIKTLNEHVEAGIYDRIMAEVERERVLGRLEGTSDVEAYKVVGDRMNEQGRFNDLVPSTKKTNQNQDTANTKQTQKVKTKPNRDEARTKARKKAASHTKSSKRAKPAPKNPLSLSDEEFEQQMLSNNFV